MFQLFDCCVFGDSSKSLCIILLLCKARKKVRSTVNPTVSIFFFLSESIDSKPPTTIDASPLLTLRYIMAIKNIVWENIL